MIADVKLGEINIQEVEKAIVLGVSADFSNPLNYLMFQKPGGAEFVNTNDIYVELNDQINSAYDAISEILILSNTADVRLNDHGSDLLGRKNIVISFNDHRHQEVIGLFKAFFENTDIKVTG